MHQRLTALTFPLILHYQGQAELELIADQTSFQTLQQQSQLLLPGADQLIDSQGRIYHLNAQYQWQATEQHVTLTTLTHLLQQHFFACAQSCVVKIQPPDLASAFAMLQD